MDLHPPKWSFQKSFLFFHTISWPNSTKSTRCTSQNVRVAQRLAAGNTIEPYLYKFYVIYTELKEETVDDAESDIVRRLAAMSPSTQHDTSDGLRSTLQAVHGDSSGGAEGTKWKQKTRYKHV